MITAVNVSTIALAAALVCLSVRPAIAQEGTYRVEGVDANKQYSGTARITKVPVAEGSSRGAVFSISWDLSDGAYTTGLGIRTGDVLSVVYQIGDGTSGLVAYAITRNTLKGRWFVPSVGGVRVFMETLTKIMPDDPPQRAASRVAPRRKPAPHGGGA